MWGVLQVLLGTRYLLVALWLAFAQLSAVAHGVDPHDTSTYRPSVTSGKNADLTYEELKRFHEIVVPEVMDVDAVPPRDRPLAALARMEAKNKSIAATALEVAVVDALTHLAAKPVTVQRAVSSRLVAGHAPSLASVQAWS